MKNNCSSDRRIGNFRRQFFFWAGRGVQRPMPNLESVNKKYKSKNKQEMKYIKMRQEGITNFIMLPIQFAEKETYLAVESHLIGHSNQL